jgi:hypothetical protein
VGRKPTVLQHNSATLLHSNQLSDLHIFVLFKEHLVATDLQLMLRRSKLFTVGILSLYSGH